MNFIIVKKNPKQQTPDKKKTTHAVMIEFNDSTKIFQLNCIERISGYQTKCLNLEMQDNISPHNVSLFLDKSCGKSLGT